MKKILGIAMTLVLMATFSVPVLANVIPDEGANSDTPEFTTQEWTEPELLPQEILDEFEGGMTIEEFLIRNQGPIPNALLDYADMPVAVVVQLDKPSLIEYVNQEGMGRGDRTADQTDYVEQLKSEQAAILGEITAGRAADVQQIGESFTKVLNGFMLRVPASMINEIRAMSGVKAVTQAPEYQLNLEYSVPLIGADVVTGNFGYTGEGVTIAVIDTGIDYTHAMLGGSGDPADYAGNDPAIVEQGSFPTAKVIGGYDFAGTNYDPGDDEHPENQIPVPDDDPLDENGHGTHVASTAAGIDAGFGSGVAPGALLYALKIFGADGGTNLTLQAIEWAMDPLGLGHLGEPVDVINMSLGADWGPADENDPEYQAVENATSIGVVVVSAAGNAGDSSYIVESPSTADSAISVAASSTGFERLPYITYGTDQYMPYTTSTNPFTETITAELVDVSVGIDPSGELCTVPDGNEGALTGKIALISRGSCNFSVKINNAETLGAVAVIVYNNEPGLISMNADGSTLPAGSVVQAGGAILQGIAPGTISIGPDDTVRVFESEDPADTIADFSSRGPRGFDSKLKPEITAPGVAIYAAAMGTGNDGVSMNGTSMATPHVAGVAALLVEAHPDWAPRYIKAVMMNTATDLVGDAAGVVPLQGAGRVDVEQAALTPFTFYADPKLISLSWGLIEIQDDFTDTQNITIRSFIDEEVTFDISVVFTSVSDGATLTPSVPSVTVPANGVASVDMTLDLVADQIAQYFGYMEEYYGFVNFTVEETDFRVPFYFVPHTYTEITELSAETEFEVNTETALLTLNQTGPLASSLWAYPVSLVSGNDPAVLDAGDLRHVGLDYAGYSPDYGDILAVVFDMWGGVHTNQPYFSEIDLYIDTPYGSVVDFNFNTGWWNGVDGTNDWVVIQVDFTANAMYLASPYGIYADFNSGLQEWYLPAAYQYIVDEFIYQPVSFDWNGNFDDAGVAYFDIINPPLGFAFSKSDPHNETFLSLAGVLDWATYHAADVQGIMLVDYNGKAGEGQSYYWPLSPYEATFLPFFNR